MTPFTRFHLSSTIPVLELLSADKRRRSVKKVGKVGKVEEVGKVTKGREEGGEG